NPAPAESSMLFDLPRHHACLSSQRFKSPHHAQRFCAAHDQINALFRPRRRLSANSYRHARYDAFDLWNDFAIELSAA
ncbi:MAG: hypothetical protein ACR2QH_16525, partial [Geminicoccaceae bacterium]